MLELDKPIQADKGLLNGACNRRACQAPGATWFNSSTRAYYCRACARAINAACRRFGETPICTDTHNV